MEWNYPKGIERYGMYLSKKNEWNGIKCPYLDPLNKEIEINKN